MINALRNILAVVAGLLLAFVLVVAVEILSAQLHPLPADFGETMEELSNHVAHYPHWVLGLVVPIYSLTAFISTWIASRIGSRTAGTIVSLLLVLAISFNVFGLPYTMWFKVVILICVPLACLAGTFYGVKKPKPTK